jgi:ABC-2 type transport system permease protein
MSIVAAEVRKLTTTRTTWAITAIGIVLVAISAAFFVLEEQFTGPFGGTDPEVAATIDQIGSTSVIVLVVGLLAMTTEFRHGTIGRTLQLTPSRTRVLLGKVLVAVAYGIGFFAVGLLVALLFLLIGSAQNDVSLAFGAEATEALWQGPVGLALTAVFGVAVGALLRSQVVAITLSLIWVLLAETIFVQFLPSVGKWLPFQALNSVFLSPEVMENIPEGMVQPLDPLVGLGVFLGYVVVVSAAALLLLRWRDV